MARAVIAALIFLVTAPLLSQFSERLEVRLHQLDVVVERRDGTPVTDLQKDDFEVRQDGVLQPITNFSLISESKSEDQARSGQRAQTAARPPRKFVFFVDEFPLHHRTREDILRQVSGLVGSMGANDEAMVMTPASREHIPLFFTNDKEAVMKTLERVTRIMMRNEDVQSLSSADVDLLLRADCGQSAEACGKRRLATLRSITAALGQVPGRKVIVLLTARMSSVPGLKLRVPGSPPPPPVGSTAGPQWIDPSTLLGPNSILPAFGNLQREVAEVGRTAAANNVPIYGLEVYEPGAAALPGMSVEQHSPSLRPITQRGTEGAMDLLLTLARETGARAYSGTGNSERMFEQIASDMSTYYSIAYRETDPQSKKSHRIEVQVRNRRDLVVRTRRSVAPRDEKQEISDRAVAALLTENPQNSLGIAARAKHPIRRGRLREMPVEIRVPIKRLTFAHEAKGYRSRFMAHIAAVGTQADFGSTQMDHDQELFIPEAKWETSQNEYFTFSVAVRLRPGKYRFAVGVTDTASRESGFQAFSVTAP